MTVKHRLAILPLLAFSAPAAAAGQVNPQGSGPIVAALMWLQGTLLGNVATAVAVIAVFRAWNPSVPAWAFLMRKA